MSYTRVIPRDLFNEAKLLKCFGILSLKVLDGTLPSGIRINIEESGQPFRVELFDCSLQIVNYAVLVNGRPVPFYSVYNSKSPHPFYCTHPDSGEEIEVFDDEGNFTREFAQAFGKS